MAAAGAPDPVAAPADDPVVRARLGVRQVAVHVLARRRFTVAGRFGLRPAPGGLATPMFDGDGTGAGEVLRIAGATLVVERGSDVHAETLTTLGRAAAVVGVDLAAEFSVGDDTPAPADPDARLAIDGDHVRGFGAWWGLGSELIDEVCATVPAVTAATVAQLWPEHFDHASTLTLGPGEAKVNVGASPGDGGEPRPYLYVGPWGDDRPGDPGYWNAPFGAVLRQADLHAHPADARRQVALDFLRRGLALLAGV